MPYLGIKSCNLYYETHGDGDPVVCISGYTCDHSIWTPILDDLANKFCVVLLDNAGSGQTIDNTPLPLTVERVASDILELMNHLDLPRPHILGHSMGGSIAQYFTYTYPDRISKLGLLATSAKWREASIYAMYSSLVLRKNNVNFDLQFENIIPWLFGQKFLSNKNNIENFKKILLQNQYPQSLEDQERQFNILKTFDSRENLSGIAAPTLIVNGVEDLLSLPYESEYLAQQIRNSKLVTLNAGHVFLDEMPKELSKILLNFLRD